MSDNNNSFSKGKGDYGGKKKGSDAPTQLYGKVQPQAIPLEEAVLGAIMLDKDALSIVLDIITSSSFYLDAHQEIYKAMLHLFEKTQPVDLLTVTEQLKSAGVLDKVGGPYYLVELTNRVASAANIEYHARIISQKHIQRELIRVSTKVIKDAFEDTTDVFSLLDEAEQGLFDITQQNLSRSYETMGTLTSRALKQLEDLASTDSAGLTGVPTGFTDLDRLTSGWQPSDLIIIAARPGMGKCLGKGTKVLMYDGSLKKVEDIHVGELLMGDDSTPRTILSLARGREKMFWVRQKDAMDYRVNESHILSLKRNRTEDALQKRDVLNISVKDYLPQTNDFKNKLNGYKVAVDFEDQAVPLPPYFLGLCLGGGEKMDHLPSLETILRKGSQSTSNATNEKVFDNLESSFKKDQDQILKAAIHNNASAKHIKDQSHSLKEALRQLDVLNNKHIPREYLVNSKPKRLELLAGLLDATGYYKAEINSYEITQNDRILAQQIKLLCDSLGFKTALIAKNSCHCVQIQGNLNSIPLKVKNQVVCPFENSTDCQMTLIKVEYDKVDDYYGFEIDGNKLFLLEDMTVTHNTSFTLALAHNAAVDFGKGVALFSLEMSNIQLVQRLISMEAEISGSKLRSGQLEDYEWQQLQSAIEKLSEVPIYIDDTPGINIFELRAKCRRMKMQHDIQLIVIDYLQLMSGGPESGKGNREQEISGISRSLKALAKELSVPVIALSQLSRAVETRGGNKRPMLSDLRECITGDTLIYRADSGAYQCVRELLEEKDFEVLAMDDELKLRKANCLEVWETGEKEVYEVETQSGHRIRASLNHPFYTIGGWQQLVDIKEGEYVATKKDVSPYFKNTIKNSNNLVTKKNTVAKSFFSIVANAQESAVSTFVKPAESDIKWEKIKSITHIGKEMTYDLHVEEYHNFVANDFIIHNSGAIEQDADIVSFIYRPEYYSILEDEEGNSLKGIGEIIIAKHRNGALDTVKLKFTDRFAKFTNLDDPDFNQLLSAGGLDPGSTTNIITRSSKMNDDEDIPF